MPPPERLPDRWSLVVETLTRPYRVTVSMVLLVSLVPFYIFLPILFPARTRYAPEVALDGPPAQPSSEPASSAINGR